MNLTIIHPCIGRRPGQRYIRGWQMEPLPSAHLAGLTPDDVSISFFDDRMEAIQYDIPTDLVAISVETYTAKRAYQIATEYRKRGIPVVMGGFHATLVTDEVLEYAEAVVVGEAETTWPQLLKDFKQGSMKRLYKAEVRPDLTYVMPDRSIFEGKDYLPVGLIEAGRGCSFKCDFCVIQKFFNSTQSRRGIDVIKEEISSLKDKRSLFFFVDDNIVSYPDQAKELYESLIPLNIKWVSQATITMTHDEELLTILKASGCQGVLIGFESLNKDNLKKMKKSFNAAKGGASEAVKRLHKYGIRLYATFIFGYDYDTMESFQEALDFCKEHSIYMVAFNHLTPFPGTPLYERLEAEGKLLYPKWWLDDRYTYGQVPFKAPLSSEVIQRECIRARQEFYKTSSILRRFMHPTNRQGMKMSWFYFFINFLLQREVAERDGYPLGDSSFEGELLKVATTEVPVLAQSSQSALHVLPGAL